MSVLRVHDVSFAYPDGTQVLNGINMEVRSDERVVLQAPSGRGKSTLCQVLAGYLTPSSGMVTLDGVPVSPQRQLGARERRANPVQLIWQHPETVVDPYLRLRSTVLEGGAVAEEVLSGLGICEEWLSRFPHELSGGELQRCCIARALASKPQFIIADEISTMLDALTQAQIWEFLLGYCQKHEVGIVLVTHSAALQHKIATRTLSLSLP